MTDPAVTVSPATDARTVAVRMRANGIGAVIVVDEGELELVDDEDLLGIVTERDLVDLVADGGDPDQATARDVMSQPVLTVEPSLKVEDAVETMVDHDVRRLAVSLEGDPRGVVSVTDVAYAEPELARRAHEHLRTRWEG